MLDRLLHLFRRPERPLRRGDIYLSFVVSSIALVVIVLIGSFFDVSASQDTLANEVGFALLFLLPLSAVFFVLFSSARNEELSAFEDFVSKHEMALFISSLAVLVVLAVLSVVTSAAQYAASARILIALLAFIVSVVFLVSFPWKSSLFLFVIIFIFVLLATLPYQNVIAQALRDESVLWVLSLLPFIATSPALFERIVRWMRTS